LRDAAATSIAIDNPRHVGDAHLVLSHAGLETTQKHYNQAAWATRALLRASFDAAGRSR